MNKLKSPKELMAARNPLVRKAVEPVDIYSQAEPTQPDVPKSVQKQSTEALQTPPTQSSKEETSLKNTESPRPYSTYLYRYQVKGIKLRAIERDINDMEIVQEAIEEYFKNHPLQ